MNTKAPENAISHSSAPRNDSVARRGPVATVAALASEASGQRGDSMVRAHSASEDARERADDTRPEPGSSAHAELVARLDDELRATVHEVNRLTPTIVEVVVRAPMAARAFKPGQFYRLQNYETLSRPANGTALAMEGLALTRASVDREQGLLSTIVLGV